MADVGLPRHARDAELDTAAQLPTDHPLQMSDHFLSSASLSPSSGGPDDLNAALAALDRAERQLAADNKIALKELEAAVAEVAAERRRSASTRALDAREEAATAFESRLVALEKAVSAVSSAGGVFG